MSTPLPNISNTSKSTLSIGTFNLKKEALRCTCKYNLALEPMVVRRRVSRRGCPNDEDAVAVLPKDWIPRHSGPVLSNYLKQRENDHEAIFKDIFDNSVKVNQNIEEKVRMLAEKNFARLQQNQLDMICIVESCDLNDGPVTEEEYNDALTRVNQLYFQRMNDLDYFKKQALLLEKQRADQLRTLLRGQFHRLVAVGHKTPKQLLHEFDERIYEINQQLLSNYRAYVDLDAKLRIQTEKGVQNNRTGLHQLYLGVSGLVTQMDSALFRMKDKNVHKLHPSAINLEKNDLSASNPPIGKLLSTVIEIEPVVNSLIEVYRKSVLKIFLSFLDMLCDLENVLFSHDELKAFNELQNSVGTLQRLVEAPLRRVSDTIQQSDINILDSTYTDVTKFPKSLISLGKCLRDTYSLLNHAGHLWDPHILRSALAKKLTVAAVEDLITNHDMFELANEMSFNMALELMCRATDVEKVNQQFDAIVLLQNKTAQMYLQHSDEETKRLAEYMNLLPVMANTLLAEFDFFLEEYPQIRETTQSSTSFFAGRTTSLRSVIPRAIFQTDLQEQALKNWRNGFIENFMANASLVPDDLRHQAQLWVDERSAILHKRYSLKMLSYHVSLDRVKVARDKRIAILQYHESRLESHLRAVYDLLDRLPFLASEYITMESPSLYPLGKWVEITENSLNEVLNLDPPNPEVRRLKMASYRPRLALYKHRFQESLDKTIEDFQIYLDHRISEARVSNVRFLSQIKLFHEGGQYGAAEAIKASAAILKAAESLEISADKAADSLNHHRTVLLGVADELLHTVYSLLDDAPTKGGKDKAVASKVKGKKK